MATEKQVQRCFIFEIPKRTKEDASNPKINIFYLKKEYYLKFYTEIIINKYYMQFCMVACR